MSQITKIKRGLDLVKNNRIFTIQPLTKNVVILNTFKEVKSYWFFALSVLYFFVLYFWISLVTLKSIFLKSNFIENSCLSIL